MKYLFHFIVCVIGFTANASSLYVLNAAHAIQASYTSSDLTESLPYWILDGQLIERTQVRHHVLSESKTACTVWLMNFSDDNEIDKSVLQTSILTTGKQIPLWKVINGRPIFVDDATSFAISYNCVVKNSADELTEVEFLTTAEFNSMFKNILEIRP